MSDNFTIAGLLNQVNEAKKNLWTAKQGVKQGNMASVLYGLDEIKQNIINIQHYAEQLEESLHVQA